MKYAAWDRNEVPGSGIQIYLGDLEHKARRDGEGARRVPRSRSGRA